MLRGVCRICTKKTTKLWKISTKTNLPPSNRSIYSDSYIRQVLRINSPCRGTQQSDSPPAPPPIQQIHRCRTHHLSCSLYRAIREKYLKLFTQTKLYICVTLNLYDRGALSAKHIYTQYLGCSKLEDELFTQLLLLLLLFRTTRNSIVRCFRKKRDTISILHIYWKKTRIRVADWGWRGGVAAKNGNSAHLFVHRRKWLAK